MYTYFSTLLYYRSTQKDNFLNIMFFKVFFLSIVLRYGLGSFGFTLDQRNLVICIIPSVSGRVENFSSCTFLKKYFIARYKISPFSVLLIQYRTIPLHNDSFFSIKYSGYFFCKLVVVINRRILQQLYMLLFGFDRLC